MRPTVTKLESGYWLVRWNQNLWFQWPVGRAPALGDGFGWVTERHRWIAQKLTEAPHA